MIPAVRKALRSARLLELEQVLKFEECPVKRFVAKAEFLSLHEAAEAEREQRQAKAA